MRTSGCGSDIVTPYPPEPYETTALRRLAGQNVERPPLYEFDGLVGKGLAIVIDTGDSVGWALTAAGSARLRRIEGLES